ncbi:Catalyzes the ferrous insertion into protoporphyrin IX (By similarity) [Musa troglodytarum]|uniref:Catalyzes the ferrous insertion into protoporphyrin IX By similarity n=1 Tax=Musa troglodytarum TaxID=320322 RepID=A0A9E7JYC1_9LILI|nr:Catalyzes the ferrous insertion into protoporphyrin IX (By similarity) [Musa troglodytarum]
MREVRAQLPCSESMKAVSSAVVQAKLLDLRGQNNIGSLDLRSTSVCCIKCTFHSSDNGLQETDKSLELPSFSCLSSDVSKAKFAKQTHISVKKHNQSRRTNYSAEASTYDGKVLSTASSAARERFGVLLLNLGGPETLNDVQPFLFNLFADPDILRLPRLFQFLQRPLAQLISVFRAPKGEGYAAIGGGSPLRRITDDQA